ncbi:UDP-N-acetylmuramate--L-alanine ligase [Janibacter alkaliphilus]|uniref:UDP-N-acetylmuramate--L-alanine ligase n=1 Tax=Janibacter alkaliphilus TaxID=1069963 RepID=A0A852X3V9_9MICO|nr:UDP-N-acetylmuramate--alanine ligase [Janibacter alkaliphilus]
MPDPDAPLPEVPRNPRFDVRAPLVPVTDLGRVHVLAAGGAGMSAVVRLLLASGVPVQGSDAKDSPLLHRLEQAGAQVWVGHDPAHLAGVDTVVVSSAIREDNPELAAARAGGLRVLHRSQALAATMATSRRVAVAGANGKTTTSSMLTVALQEAGERPSFALGGELTTQGTNAALGEGDAFVAEADESDGSFVAYHPHVAVVTNVQPDHLDFYGDYPTVEAAYLEFAQTLTDDGLLIVCSDDPGARRLAARARRAGLRVLGYGFDEGADLRLAEPVLDGTTASAGLSGPGGGQTLRIAVPGRHNLLNAAAAYLAATAGLGVPADAVLAGLAAFGGTRRRFETKGVVGGVTVVDDYAHNPGKVEAVVRTAREIAGEHRLLVVFQPHLYSRTRDFAAEFAAGLAPADEVVLLEVYGAREDPLPGVSSALVADPLRAAGTASQVLGREAAVRHVAALAGPGDLVLTVGAGDVTELGPDLLRALAR